jgi:hypothetical protein
LRGTFYIAVLSCGVYGFASGVEPPRSDLPLEVVADAPLTGQTTRWDYLCVDGSKHRLYIAHLGDSVVTVFDTQRPCPSRGGRVAGGGSREVRLDPSRAWPPPAAGYALDGGRVDRCRLLVYRGNLLR